MSKPSAILQDAIEGCTRHVKNDLETALDNLRSDAEVDGITGPRGRLFGLDEDAEGVVLVDADTGRRFRVSVVVKVEEEHTEPPTPEWDASP